MTIQTLSDFDGQKFLLDFVNACGDKDEEIQVSSKASDNAKTHFHLNSDEEIYAFISGGGLTQVDYVQEELWEYAPEKERPLSNHVYNFKSNKDGKKGYISIAYMPKRAKWKLKSLTIFDPKKHTFAKWRANQPLLKERKK